MLTAIVVPSCREDQIQEFVRSWDSAFAREDVRLYIVEDAGARSFRLDCVTTAQVTHLCWSDAPPGMLDCISVRSPGCRQIGFWKAYHDGCELLITLDDDVRPAPGSDLIVEFSQVLNEGLPLWIDPLLNYRSRGFPTANLGRIRTDFHVGCFLGVPDVDAKTQLLHERDFIRVPPRYLPRPTVVPPGFLIPVNGGVAGWRRELTPFIHYTLWDRNLRYRRFDDIWMGVILKHMLDLSGLRMSFGPPSVRHCRASDARQNLEYERAGGEWNERFWELLRRAIDGARDSGRYALEEALALVVRCLMAMDNPWARREGEALLRWRGYF